MDLAISATQFSTKSSTLVLNDPAALLWPGGGKNIPTDGQLELPPEFVVVFIPCSSSYEAMAELMLDNING